MRDNDVLLEYGYNNRRLLESERLSGFSTVDWTTNHEYDANGFLSATIYPDNHRVEFAPNALGQATKAGVYAVGASYFPNGALKQFTYAGQDVPMPRRAGCPGAAGNGHVHTLTQNERGLPETSRDAMGSTVVLNDTYLYDENGNVLGIDDAITGSLGDRAMTYDDLDRLVSVSAGSAQGGNALFAYDALDNIRQLDQGARTVRHAYAAYNRLTSVANAAGTTLYTYGYDDRGNQTSRTGAYVDTFTFDDANRLTASTVHDAAGVASTSTYLYDGLNRRVREISTASTYSHYGQDGKLIYQSDLTTTPDERHVYVYLAGSLVAKRTLPVGGTIFTTYQHTDALGSPVATTDQAGTTITRERLTAYGEPADGTWKRGPGFTGHVMDPGSRLVYMQQRYYDPFIGRFVSADPVGSDGISGEFNRYSYSRNPYGSVDPDGRSFVDAVEKFTGGQVEEVEAHAAFVSSQAADAMENSSATKDGRRIAEATRSGVDAAAGIVEGAIDRTSATAEGTVAFIGGVSVEATKASAKEPDSVGAVGVFGLGKYYGANVNFEVLRWGEQTPKGGLGAVISGATDIDLKLAAGLSLGGSARIDGQGGTISISIGLGVGGKAIVRPPVTVGWEKEIE